MIRHTATPDSGRGRVLTLIVPVSANWNVSARNMSFFGIGVAQYVRQLEAQGTRVHLIACVTAQIYNTRVTHSWTVKNPDQGLDLASVAFSIGHPACFRRLGFALLERSEAQEISNYGVSIDTRVSDILNAPANAFVLNGMKDANENAVTPADALAFVERQITEALEKAA
jgi:hypothetical protein